MIRNPSFYLSLFLLFVCISKQGIASDSFFEIDVGVYENHFELINKINNEGACRPLDEFHWREHQGMEFSVLCHAFQLSNLSVKFNLIPFPNNVRLRKELNLGNIDVLGHTIWEIEHEAQFAYKSVEVLSKSQSVKGIYVKERHPLLNGIQRVDELKHYSAVTNFNWTIDLAILKCIGSRITSSNDYAQMFGLVNLNRVDYVIAHFSNTLDMVRKEDYTTLYPVPNLKISMNNPLHFLVSKKKGEKRSILLLRALNDGLKLMKQRGDLLNAYRGTGYVQTRVEDWPYVVCEGNEAKIIYP